jgi:hypothetical protein
MKRWLVGTILAASAVLAACGGRAFAPIAPAGVAGSDAAPARSAKTAPTPFPLPSATPDWQIVEAAKPWDFKSTGPDRGGCGKSEGLTYRVGPGRPYPNPRDVPWLRLLPCDTVLIYPRAQPYSDVIYVASRGRVHKAITIAGVLDASGARPVLDGSHAVTSGKEAVDKYLLCAGMVIVGKPDYTKISYARGYKPGYLIIENLEIRNAFGKYPGSNQPQYTCTDTHGKPNPWPQFTSGLYFNPAEHVLIQNTFLHNNGLGAFVNSLDREYGQSRDFIVKDNVLEDNGNGAASQHNFYFEVVGERVIHNYFGPPIADTQGENIKDRGVCVEYADNYIDSGNNLIAFRDPQSNAEFEWHQKDAFGDQCVGELYVHGNTFVSRGPTEFQGISTVIGFGDGTIEDAPQFNRFGSVYFYNNVAIAIANRNNYGLKAAVVFQNGNQLKPSTLFGIDNLFYTAPQSAGQRRPQYAACFWQQYVDFTEDWANEPMLKKLAKATDGNEAVGTPCDGSGMSGVATSKANPGFVNFASGDYHLTSASPFYGLTAPLPAAVTLRHLQPDGIQYPSPPPG